MKLKKLLKLYVKAVKIVKNEDAFGADWGDIYDSIFNGKISYKVNKYLDYYDPNVGYEKDVKAFMQAFRNYVITRL